MASFIVLLRPTGHGDRAAAARGHRAWIQQGLADGVFLVAGSLGSDGGGALLALADDHADLERRVSDDPFVASGIVESEILAFSPAFADERLAFLLRGPSA